MEETIKRIIRLNVELEGVLRVVAERKSDEAMESARGKFAEMSALFASIEAVTAMSGDKEEGKSDPEEVEKAAAPDGKELPEPEPETKEKEPEKELPVESAEEEPIVSAPSREPAAEPRKVVHGDIRKVFTLNDKFLFRRELFSGNDAEFNDTLDLIESMASLREAEEYLYEDLQWDAENDSVRDFMNIITGYFSQQSR